jgi:hypothetical protein
MPETSRRKGKVESRVQISGPRLRAALTTRGLSLRDAVAALKGAGEATLSVAGLGKIVAAPGTVTTRRSVRNALAGLCGVASDWLSGFGPDRDVVELLAHQVAGGGWDQDEEFKAPPRLEGGGPDDAVKRIHKFAQHLWANQKTRERLLLEILDLELWVRLIGDPRPAEISKEAKEQFAISLARALRIATTRPIKGHQLRPHGSQLRPSSKALEKLRDFLKKTPSREG